MIQVVGNTKMVSTILYLLSTDYKIITAVTKISVLNYYLYQLLNGRKIPNLIFVFIINKIMLWSIPEYLLDGVDKYPPKGLTRFRGPVKTENYFF